MTPEEFREYGHLVIDWIADYRAGVVDRSVMARTTPGLLKSSLPASPPDQPEGFAAVVRDLDELIMPGITHWQHPRFFAYFPSNATLSSVLGDLLSSGIGVIGLSWQASPALTELEEVVVDWMRQLFGLSSSWSGVIQDTASTSTLVALLCARERSTNYGLARGGLQSGAQPLVIYTSDQAHSSVEKAALLAGFGRDHVRSIPHDRDFALDQAALADAIRRDLAEGRLPCAVVATIGTTTSTAIDPVRAIARVAREFNLWLHVDAAMAGSAMILPECRAMWEGIEDADSFVVNAHKWLGAVFDCSLYYVRDPDHLVRVMSTNPSYLRTSCDDRVKNLRDWGIPLGRRFRALKLWCLLRSEGVESIRSRLRRDLANARWLSEQVVGTNGWRLVAPVRLQTVCVRHVPDGLADEALDRHTLTWVDRVNRSGVAYLTPAILAGRWMARVSIGAEATERNDVQTLWETMRRAAEHPVSLLE